jgi:hypothetical protein
MQPYKHIATPFKLTFIHSGNNCANKIENLFELLNQLVPYRGHVDVSALGRHSLRLVMFI